MKDLIVKVQVPLFGGTAGDGLVYAEGRKHMKQQPLPERVVQALKGDPKGYFRGTWSGTAGWDIGERVPDENW